MKLPTLLLLLAACLAAAAPIDGTWTSEMKMRAGKKAGATERIVRIVMNLKADGNQLTGTVESGARKRNQTARIQDGKLDGNQFSFTTIQNSKKKGEQKITWRGTIDGDSLTGTRTGAGKRRGQPFTAKRG
jgi:hypothetical protein